MRLAGYQPQYFPRLHYFARILNADLFEFSDTAQFVKKHKFTNPGGTTYRGKSYQADTPIKTGNGLAFLTVPVAQHNHAITHTPIATGNWQSKHLKTIRHAYGTAPHFSKLFPQIEKLLGEPHQSLADLNIATTVWGLATIVGLDQTQQLASLEEVNHQFARDRSYRIRRLVRISTTDILPPNQYHDANDWIIAMCNTLNATDYYCGETSAGAYMDPPRFTRAGITITQQQWTCPSYHQQFYTHSFLPNLSIIDLLMNEDRAAAGAILQEQPTTEPV